MEEAISILILIFVTCYQILYYSFKIGEEKKIPFYTDVFQQMECIKTAYNMLNQIWVITFAVMTLSYFILIRRKNFLFALFSYSSIQAILIPIAMVIGSYLANNLRIDKRGRLFYLHLWLNIIWAPFWLPLYYTGKRMNQNIEKKGEGIFVFEGYEKQEKSKTEEEIPILDWEDIILKEIMVPRVEIIAIKSDATLEELYKLFLESKYSRLPVYEKDIDSVIGVVTIKDFLSNWDEENKNQPVSNLIKPVIYVPETKKITTMLKEFKERKISIAIVLNEYGGTAGLITLHDIMENIVGEIKDEYDEDQKDDIVKVENGYLMSGKVDIETVRQLLAVKIEEGDYETISGYILYLLGRVPAVGEKIKAKNFLIEIISSDRRKINRIKIEKTIL